MDIRFLCLQGGKKFFGVLLNGESIFVGTRPECARFIQIHEEKVARDLEDAMKTPRGRPVAVRTYRQSRLRA